MKTVTYFCLIHDYIPKCLKRAWHKDDNQYVPKRRITTINKTQSHSSRSLQSGISLLMSPDMSLQLTKQMYFAFGESENSYPNCPMPQSQHPRISEDLALGAGITIFTLCSQLSHLYQHPKHVHHHGNHWV